MRRVRYSVAASLDGYIAGPSGEFDWITMDPAIDFAAFFNKIDTVVVGRETFEVVRKLGPDAGIPAIRTIVISRTLRQDQFPDVTISKHAEATVHSLRGESGKDIWLMGGGKLFSSLLAAGLVDLVEVAIMPVVLGQGLPLLAGAQHPTKLKLVRHEVFASGIVLLRYEVER